MYHPSLFVKAFASPMRYYQGPGVLAGLSGRLLKSLGQSPFILGGQRALDSLEKHGFFRALEDNGLRYLREPFRGECCDKEVERLSGEATDGSCDLIVGAGGGKALDAAKSISSKLDLPVICIPTIASTDAPTSSLSVMYTLGHEFQEYVFYERSPTMVLVDTEVIAEAPARFLACGIGDAFSKKFEVQACYGSERPNQIVKPAEGRSPLTGLYLAEATHQILGRWAKEAMECVKIRNVGVALEAVVEACVLLSGLSFESGGLAAAHSIANGFSLLEQEMSPRQYHGELVFFGTCVQLALEGRLEDSMRDIFRFAYEIGLPISLRDMGLSVVSKEELWRVAEKAMAKAETIHKMPIDVTTESVFSSIEDTNSMGERFSKTCRREPY